MFQAKGRSGLAAAVGLLLVLSGSSLQAGALPALGSLHASGAVYLGPDAAPQGSTIYSGDRLRTAEGEAAISLPRVGVLVLSRQSALSFRGSSSGPSVSLDRGKLSFTLSTQGAFQLESDGIVFSSVGSFPSIGEVALADDGSILLAVRQGSVAVGNLQRQRVLLRAGEMLTINPRVAQSGQSQTVGTGAHGKATIGDKLRTFRIGPLGHAASAVVVIGGLGAVVAAGTWVVASGPTPVSPSSP